MTVYCLGALYLKLHFIKIVFIIVVINDDQYNDLYRNLITAFASTVYLNRFCTDIAYFSLHCLISESTSILCSQGRNCD